MAEDGIIIDAVTPKDHMKEGMREGGREGGERERERERKEHAFSPPLTFQLPINSSYWLDLPRGPEVCGLQGSRLCDVGQAMEGHEWCRE